MTWWKSSRSGGAGGGSCVEVGVPDDVSVVAVRDTKDRDGGTLVVTPAAFAAFTTAVRSGKVS